MHSRNIRRSQGNSLIISDLVKKSENLPGYPSKWSKDLIYRYTLWRLLRSSRQEGDPIRYLMVIGLNPSTATDTLDDPTITRLKYFSLEHGFDAFCMTNLFAFRATDPADMKRAAQPVGPDNSYWLRTIAEGATSILGAWGAQGHYLNRANQVKALLGKPLWALCTTQNVQPGHPLYKRADLQPFLYYAPPEGIKATHTFGVEASVVQKET